MNRRGWWIWGWALAALGFLVHAYRVYGTDVALIDDAFIFFRYARHWAEGYGLVWNVGERPVEGMSSLLYTALLAAGIRGGVDVVLWATVLNLLLGLAILSLTLALAQNLGLVKAARVIPPLLVAASPHVAFWAGTGMDTMLFAALLLLAIWFTVRERWIMAGIAFALLSMARLDAVPLPLLTAIVLWKRPDVQKGALYRPAPAILGPFLLLFLPFYLARWAYFGWPLPNTFYAKMGGGVAAWKEGLLYVGAFLRRPEVAVVMVLAVIGVGAARDWRTRYVALMAALLLLRAVAASGDWMPHFRLMVPVWPLLAVLATQGLVHTLRVLQRTSSPGTRDMLILALVLMILVGWPSLSYIVRRPWRLWRPLRLVEPMHASQYAMGLALREVLCPGDEIALIAAGAAAYLNDDHVIIDMLGLSDVRVAHSPPVFYKGRWDPGHTRLDVDYLLSRAPEWIQLDTHLFSRPDFQLRDWMPPQVLWGDARIREVYEIFPVRVEVPTGLPRPRVGYIFFLHRKDAPLCGSQSEGRSARRRSHSRAPGRLATYTITW